eukprot:755178-Hanusia_phi.AAC.3
MARICRTPLEQPRGKPSARPTRRATTAMKHRTTRTCTRSSLLLAASSSETKCEPSAKSRPRSGDASARCPHALTVSQLQDHISKLRSELNVLKDRRLSTSR